MYYLCPKINKGDWRRVDLPHDFQIEQPWVQYYTDKNTNKSGAKTKKKNPLTRRGFKTQAKGYYRLHYTPSDEMKDQRVLLDFEGIMYTADVYMNHHLVGGTNYGYVGFEIDVTNELKHGEDNLIEVVADTREPENSRWYTGLSITLAKVRAGQLKAGARVCSTYLSSRSQRLFS